MATTKQFALSVLGTAVAGVALSSPMASAQDSARPMLEEVLVSAQRKVESMQDVPMAVSAYGAEFLQQHKIENLQDLAELSSSLAIPQTVSTRNSGIFIRGVGSQGQNAGVDTSVGLYLDGVYIPRNIGLLSSLSDIESIEVLKGPQGTLFGGNTPAGVISVNTKAPTDEVEAFLRIGAGNFGSQDISGFVSGPITDSIRSRVSFWQSSNDGTIKLKTGGYGDTRDNWGGRLRFDMDLSDSTQLQFTGHYGKTRNTFGNFEWVDISDQALAFWDTAARNLGLDRDVAFPSREGDGFEGNGEKLDWESYGPDSSIEEVEQFGVSARLLHDFASGHSLSASYSYRDLDTFQNPILTYTAMDTFFSEQPEVHNTHVAEILFASPQDQALRYSAGVFYQRNDTEFDTISGKTDAWRYAGFGLVENGVARGALEDTPESRSRAIGVGRNDEFDQTHDSYAAFGQIDYDISERFSVSVGGRIARDEKEAVKRVRTFSPETEVAYQEFGLTCQFCSFEPGAPDAYTFGALFGSTPFEESISATEFTYSLSASYDFSDQTMAYVRFATGYKSPGINARPIRLENIPVAFSEETSENFEVGIKAEFFDNRFRLNLAAFSSVYDDLQQVAANPVADTAGVFGVFLTNAGSLDTHGVDLDYQWLLTEGLSLSGSFAYLDATYDGYRRAPCPSKGDIPADADLPDLCDFSGQTPQMAPKFSTSNTLRYEQSLSSGIDWFAQATWSFMDDHNVRFDLDARAEQEAYSLLNFTAGFQSIEHGWGVTAWVKNATEEVYITSMALPALAGFPPNDTAAVRLGQPRTYGVQFTYTF